MTRMSRRGNVDQGNFAAKRKRADRVSAAARTREFYANGWFAIIGRGVYELVFSTTVGDDDAGMPTDGGSGSVDDADAGDASATDADTDNDASSNSDAGPSHDGGWHPGHGHKRIDWKRLFKLLGCSVTGQSSGAPFELDWLLFPAAVALRRRRKQS